MVAQIYLSIPSEYDSMMKDITYRPPKFQTVNNIVHHLIEAENNKNNKLVTNNNDSSLISRLVLIDYLDESSTGHVA
jgi:hypothetical protein